MPHAACWRAVVDRTSRLGCADADTGRVAIIVRQEGTQHLSIMAADGTNARTLAASITPEGSEGQGSTDWSPDGKWIVAAGRDAQGAGLFLIPVDGGAPARRLVSGEARLSYHDVVKKTRWSVRSTAR